MRRSIIRSISRLEFQLFNESRSSFLQIDLTTTATSPFSIPSESCTSECCLDLPLTQQATIQSTSATFAQVMLDPSRTMAINPTVMMELTIFKALSMTSKLVKICFNASNMIFSVVVKAILVSGPTVIVKTPNSTTSRAEQAIAAIHSTSVRRLIKTRSFRELRFRSREDFWAVRFAMNR